MHARINFCWPTRSDIRVGYQANDNSGLIGAGIVGVFVGTSGPLFPCLPAYLLALLNCSVGVGVSQALSCVSTSGDGCTLDMAINSRLGG